MKKVINGEFKGTIQGNNKHYVTIESKVPEGIVFGDPAIITVDGITESIKSRIIAISDDGCIMVKVKSFKDEYIGSSAVITFWKFDNDKEKKEWWG